MGKSGGASGEMRGVTSFHHLRSCRLLHDSPLNTALGTQNLLTFAKAAIRKIINVICWCGMSWYVVAPSFQYLGSCGVTFLSS